MIITAIRLTDFQCYHGADNLFEFSEGLNVIIGDNTAGKSKLYDAFYWVLHDRIPSYKHQKTEFVKEKFVNELTKSKALDKKPIKVEVELTFRDSQNEYQFIRSFNIWRDGYEWKSDTGSKEKAFRKDVLSFKPYEDIAHVKRLIMNEAFEPYMWFQGEQVEAILDFEKPETLKKAIEVLSGVKEFEDIKMIAKQAKEAAEEALNTQLRRNRNASSRATTVQDEIADLRLRISAKEEAQEKAQSELHRADKRRAELRLFEQDSKDLSRINEAIELTTKKLIKKKEDVERQAYDVTKNLFNKYWLLANTQPLLTAFELKFDDYRSRRQERLIQEQVEKRVEKLAVKLELPPDMPSEKYLQKMLSNRHCSVCNRPFEEHSEAEKHITLLINHPEKQVVKPSKATPQYHNFLNDLQSLEDNGQKKCKGLEVVKNEVGAHIFFLRELESERDGLQAELDNLQTQRDDILANLPQVTESAVVNATQEIKRVDNDIRDGSHKIGGLAKEIESLKKQLGEKEKELADIAAKNLSSPKYVLTTQFLTELFELTDRTRQRIFQELVERLEDEANKHYTVMTEQNRGFRGKIKLERVNNDEYAPKIVSSDGVEISALNQANNTLVKLSVIMAIITGRRAGNTADLYPLISDAPTSNFSENYTIGFCKRVSTVYRQAILMNKEFYLNKDLKNQLFNEVEKLGRVYRIESLATDGLREDLTATNTKILIEK